MSGGENSCSELVAQIRAFTQYEKPYDLDDYDNEDEDYDQNKDEGDDTKAANNNKLKISRWVNIMDKELQELLQTEVKVIIDISSSPPLDHGFQEFNMEEVLDRILT
ncbi:uncharacterized protein OCT59_006455 [Rhizophagus irregularis]|uniref:uncharacterized protein n=1 Tax=Rhizophagus irregularis TaxID=588596 RepID=UPI00332FD937|nr:hypothetical protein OCT59_006455 [Rhizophagus irregularis]